MRRRDQPPQHAEDQEIVAPVVAVDDEAFGDHPEIGGIDGVIGRPPRAGNEDKARRHDERDGGEREIRKAPEPSARHERIKIHVVRRLGVGELQRTEPERLIERDLGGDEVAAEAAEMAGIVVEFDARTRVEQVGDLADRQQRGHQQRDRQRPEHCNEHKAQAPRYRPT